MLIKAVLIIYNKIVDSNKHKKEYSNYYSPYKEYNAAKNKVKYAPYIAPFSLLLERYIIKILYRFLLYEKTGFHPFFPVFLT
jgi:hypothetical protein